MTIWKLKILGCDNDAGVFERGGDLDQTVIRCESFDLAERIAEIAGVRYGIADNVTTTIVRKGLRLVSMVDGDMGEALIVAAEEQQ